MKLEFPILYCCYNRPDLVLKSIDILKRLKPKKLYITCDGPKESSEDIKKCNEVKNIIEKTTFLSEVVLKFRDNNLGCKIAMSESINWFFNHEEEGVILEDDILPSLDFFKFCEYSLKKYRNKENIMMISGTNYLGNNVKSNKYLYSEHFIIWGWATWKRAWSHYDVDMLAWKNKDVVTEIKSRFDEKTFKFLETRFNQIFLDYKDTWDIQWHFACIKNKGLCVVPEANLVKNIGIEGTHSKKFYETLLLDYGVIDMRKLESPKTIEMNKKYDLKINKKFHFKNKFIQNLKSWIKTIIK